MGAWASREDKEHGRGVVRSSVAMRLWAPVRAALLFGLLSCGGGGDGDGAPLTLLSMNVVVDESGLVFYPREVARACVCSAGEWPEIGECVSGQDGLSCQCEPAPADCLDSIRVEQEGALLGEWAYASTSRDAAYSVWVPVEGLVALSAATVLVEGCGGSARLPLQAPSNPIPTIVGRTFDGTMVTVEWSSDPPAASALVSAGDGFAASTCHVAAGVNPSYAPGGDGRFVVDMHAFAAPVVQETDLGSARLWYGSSAYRTWP